VTPSARRITSSRSSGSLRSRTLALEIAPHSHQPFATDPRFVLPRWYREYVIGLQPSRYWNTNHHYMGMATGDDRLYFWNGCLYVPFHSAPLAAGAFLSISANSIDQHLEVPPEDEFRHGVRDRYVDGIRTHRPRLFAAQIRGNSMIERDVLDGDFVLIQHADFAYPEYGKIVVIERLGEEEGMGAWTLKHLVLEQPSSSGRNELGDEFDFENPSILLRCDNPQFRSWLLDPSGRYRVRGVLLRSLRPEAVRLVDSDMLRRVATDEE
jgi:Peptidase S24-like